ncbi:3-oxoacyl-[acyl-carrier-protein] reductase FabG-like [Rhipicephalus sanguineus]|uniref:3-oxoacyl-[acyl-carrier-protein] reductase FabG-like n=1 Tax=Rhipicephalus sanguineus TaxID=34632 RepID=UPI0020C3DA06|nr:3-oxoacyl-[acyl-carrier-protein] reductase FabG-like [Rhipicephalus sanguineus]
MSFTGRLALVTAGASGIGETVCSTLAAEGSIIVVADRQLHAAKKFAESLPGDVKSRSYYVDVGDSSSVEQLFSDIRNTFSEPLSMVVNSAGISCKCSFIDCHDETFDDVIGVNLKAALEEQMPGVTISTSTVDRLLDAYSVKLVTQRLADRNRDDVKHSRKLYAQWLQFDGPRV